jgi:hypothetical protein
VRLPGPFGACRRSPLVADATVPAPSGRWTARQIAAYNGSVGAAAAELLVGGVDQRITNNSGYAAPPIATRRPHTDRSMQAETPRQESQRCNKLGEYDAAVGQARPPPHRRRRSRALFLLARLSLPAAPPCTPRTPHMHHRGTCMPRPRSSAHADAPAA